MRPAHPRPSGGLARHLATPNARRTMELAQKTAEALHSEPVLHEMRRSLGIESGLGRDVDEELERDADDLLDALPLLMKVMQNVGDVFSGEEIAMNMQEDIAKSSAAHDTVDDEVETYGKLRRLVRLDKFSEPDQFVHVLSRLADENTCTILHALVGSLATPNPGGQPRRTPRRSASSSTFATRCTTGGSRRRRRSPR